MSSWAGCAVETVVTTTCASFATGRLPSRWKAWTSGASPTTAETCAWALARGHARTGDAPGSALYIGRGDNFAQALLDFARGYADQTERDFDVFAKALATRQDRGFQGV